MLDCTAFIICTNLKSVTNTMKQKYILIAGLVILIIAGLFIFKDQLLPNSWTAKESTKRVTPKSVTVEFYNNWLTDLKSTTTSPYKSGLLESPSLSLEVRMQIEKANTSKEKGSVDPVLCLPKIPNRIDVEEMSVTDNKAAMLVKPRDKRITTEHQAIVSLTKVSDTWLITKIDCMVGEMMVDKEFAFEKNGVLLKDSIEAPYSKENWHLVYEQEAQAGFVVPLTFNEGSLCVKAGSAESVCDASTLTETTKVFIQADMTETGATVKRMTFE